MSDKIQVGIVGLGYVGLTTSACLCRCGVGVVGFEASQEKVDALLGGLCPISEPGVAEALRDGLAKGLFRVSTSADDSVLPDIVLVCVGTPNLPDGNCDLRAVRHVFEDLGDRIARDTKRLAPLEVVLRSTVPPGTLRGLRREYPDLAEHAVMCTYPEFLREGVAMKDFMEPPQTIVGLCEEREMPTQLLGLLATLGFKPKLVRAEAAELVKSASNAFHALKVAFANEIGRLSTVTGGDGVEVMRLLVQDTVLNVSAKYLMPGVPFGGSCLPKDTRMLVAVGRQLGLGMSLLDACGRSNQDHVQYIADAAMRSRPRVVSILGIAFKEGTDDVRESAGMTLVRELVARGTRVRAHDFTIDPEHLFGANRTAWHELFDGRRASFHCDVTEANRGAEVTVRMHADPRYNSLAFPQDYPVLDVFAWRSMA